MLREIPDCESGDNPEYERWLDEVMRAEGEEEPEQENDMALKKQCRNECGPYIVRTLNTGLWQGQLVAKCEVCGETWLYPEFALIPETSTRKPEDDTVTI